MEYGERSSKYFLNLENRNYINKSITEIKISEKESVKDQSKILKLQEEFYENLYSQKTIDQASHYSPNINNLPKISDEEKEQLDFQISKAELDFSLRSLKNNKTPGPDGYTAEFLKKFWDALGDFCYEAIIESLDRGFLTDTQTRGIITCLPKQGKTRDALQNWRPISLLNTLYKLLSITITNRLRTVLPKLIHEDQKGFMANRSITDNTRLMMDVVLEMERRYESGLILLVDYEKAFDSLSWGFIS